MAPREREDTKGKRGGVSLDDDDAIDVGLFAAGPARIKESVFTTYDYQGTSRRPPLVWLITFERGEGKEKETYEQPYTIGKGWDLDKKTGALIPKNGQTGLPKSCNAILYLVKYLKKALAKAKIDASPLADGDPTVLEGMEVVLDRIDQQERDIKDNDRGARGRNDEREDRGPRTILVIDEVESAPWEKGGGKKRKARDEEDEDEPKARRGKAAADDDDDDEEEAAPKAGKGKARGKADDDDDDGDDAPGYSEEAVEALIAAVEKGPIDVDDLEAALAKVLKGNKQASKIIDVATGKKFLASEKGWTYDAKKGVIDAE